MRKNSFKKFAGILSLLLALLFVFCACAPKPDTEIPENPPGTEQPSDPGTDQPSDPEKPEGPDQPSDPEGPDEPEEPEKPSDPAEAEKYSFRPTVNGTLPAIRIDTEDGRNDFATVPNRDAKLQDAIEYVKGTVTVDQCDGAYALEAVPAQVKARGNYTLDYEKKPLRIKFDKKQSMLGLHDGKKYKNWVLLADWKDLSMSNNATAFYFGKTILGSDGFYSSDFCNVEVYLNGAYWGMYLLVEQQEAKDGRSSVPEVPELESEAGETGYTGTDVGYFMEYDGYYTDERNMPNGAGDPTFELDYNNGAPLTRYDGGRWDLWDVQRGYTLKSDIYDDAQRVFIRNYLENAYRIAYSAAYEGKFFRFNRDYTALEPTSGSVQEVVSEVIDVQSLADIYILSEIACDPDLGWSSFYLSVDMSETGGKKVIFEAPWDYDSAFGIKNGFVNSGEGVYAGNSSNPWLLLLIGQDWFRNIVKEKWNKLCNYGVLERSLALVEEYKTTLSAAYEKNYTRWKSRIDYGNGELIWELNTYRTQGEAADYLYRWLHTRLNFLNSLWGNGKDVLDEDKTPIPEEPEEGAVAYRFEAERCAYTGNLQMGEHAGASGGRYLGYVDRGGTITLTVTAAADTSAYLFIGLGRRSISASFNEWFSLKVNGAAVTVPYRPIGAIAAGEEEWYAWTELKVAPVPLKAGTNTLVFTVCAETATNVDYFVLYSKAKLGS